METKPSDIEFPVRQSLACGLVLAALLATPLAVVATMAQSRSDAPTSANIAGHEFTSGQLGNIGPFAFGYVEFDVDPALGVPGFDSWPPGSGRRTKQEP
jgi:hypothetical protein